MTVIWSVFEECSKCCVRELTIFVAKGTFYRLFFSEDCFCFRFCSVPYNLHSNRLHFQYKIVTIIPTSYVVIISAAHFRNFGDSPGPFVRSTSTVVETQLERVRTCVTLRVSVIPLMKLMVCLFFSHRLRLFDSRLWTVDFWEILNYDVSLLPIQIAK